MSPVTAKLDGIPVMIPGGGVFPPTDVFVNFRLVQSSNIRRVGWDEAGNVYIEFKGGGLYAYMGVSRQRAVAMAYSKSVGRYFAKKVKGQYDTIKLR